MFPNQRGENYAKSPRLTRALNNNNLFPVPGFTCFGEGMRQEAQGQKEGYAKVYECSRR